MGCNGIEDTMKQGNIFIGYLPRNTTDHREGNRKPEQGQRRNEKSGVGSHYSTGLDS